jgi:hypothetical protein
MKLTFSDHLPLTKSKALLVTAVGVHSCETSWVSYFKTNGSQMAVSLSALRSGLASPHGKFLFFFFFLNLY